MKLLSGRRSVDLSVAFVLNPDTMSGSKTFSGSSIPQNPPVSKFKSPHEL